MKKRIFEGRVERGEGIALRDYDLPTANLSFEKSPRLQSGVYAAITTHEGTEYESVVCYGVGDPPKFEVHLFNFDSMIYGKKLRVELLKRVSELIPWESRERMRQKISHDIEMVQEVFAKRKK